MTCMLKAEALTQARAQQLQVWTRTHANAAGDRRACMAKQLAKLKLKQLAA